MNLSIQLFTCVVFLYITASDAVLSEWFTRCRTNDNDPFDIRIDDHVTVWLKSDDSDTCNILSGFLKGPLERPERPARGYTDDRFFVRLPNGVVYYADLLPRGHLLGGSTGPGRFYIEGRQNKFFTGVLSSRQPSKPESVLLTKDIPNNPKTFHMWGDLVRLEGSVPRWAKRSYIHS